MNYRICLDLLQLQSKMNHHIKLRETAILTLILKAHLLKPKLQKFKLLKVYDIHDCEILCLNIPMFSSDNFTTSYHPSQHADLIGIYRKFFCSNTFAVEHFSWLTTY